jgi:hypothetical protein
MNTIYAVLALGLGYPELKALSHATLHKEHCKVALLAALERQEWRQDGLWPQLWPQKWLCPHQVHSFAFSSSIGLLGHVDSLWILYEVNGHEWPWLIGDSCNGSIRYVRDLPEIVGTLVPNCNH